MTEVRTPYVQLLAGLATAVLMCGVIALASALFYWYGTSLLVQYSTPAVVNLFVWMSYAIVFADVVLLLVSVAATLVRFFKAERALEVGKAK